MSAARAVPGDRLLAETDSPYLAPQPVRGRRNEPANVIHTVKVLADTRGEDPVAARRRTARQRNGCVRAHRDVTVAPKKALGQHFLADRNILDVIGRLSSLDSGDVVLEVGPGLGVLTRYLADRVALVHAIELDVSLEPALREALAGADNVRVLFGDALRLDLGALDPAPPKLVANLPYNVATPIVVESLDGLPSVDSWCVMVQREVADRFFAEPGTKAYGAVSVLVRIATERTGFHPVSRTVFRPVPNVDSALVAFAAASRRRLRRRPRVVAAAFAHRRKTLANSLALAGVAEPRAGRRRRSRRSGGGPRSAPRRSSRPSSSRSRTRCA